MPRIDLDKVFIGAFLLGVSAAWLAGFFPISIETYFLVASLWALCVVSRLTVAYVVAPPKALAKPHMRFTVVPLWGICLVLAAGAIHIINLRIDQLSEFSSLQDLRLALIEKDLPELRFPLSNVQSFAHALGVILYACSHYYDFQSSRQKAHAQAAAALLLLCSATIAVAEANRASIIIILLQLVGIRAVAGRLPSMRTALSAFGAVICLFLVSQAFIRQKAELADAGFILELALKNVASYIGGGLVAFDQILLGHEAAPPYRFPLTGAFANVFLGARPDDAAVSPFLALSQDVSGNVYSALFYLGLHKSIVLGALVFSIVATVGNVAMRMGKRNLIWLVTSSHFVVAMVLWPFSEYLVSLLPLFGREIVCIYLVRCVLLERAKRANRLRTATA